MYHIRNDKRCLQSAAAIAEALEHLMLRKPFTEITVSDIQRSAGIGRSTFYRHFDTINDVVEYSVDESFKELVKDFNELDPHSFTLSCLNGLILKGDVMIKLLSSECSWIVAGSLRKNLLRIAEGGIDGQGGAGLSDKGRQELQFAFAVFSSACISVIRIWDENGREESLEELAGYLERYLNYTELYSIRQTPL